MAHHFLHFSAKPRLLKPNPLHFRRYSREGELLRYDAFRMTWESGTPVSRKWEMIITRRGCCGLPQGPPKTCSNRGSLSISNTGCYGRIIKYLFNIFDPFVFFISAKYTKVYNKLLGQALPKKLTWTPFYIKSLLQKTFPHICNTKLFSN